MAKKQPIKNDYESINFRLAKELKAQIEANAEGKNQTTSAYVRDILEDVHNGNYYTEKEKKSERASFLYSKEFLQLMVWIYRKRSNSDLEIKKNKLSPYIKTLKKVDSYLPDLVVREFDKVLNDVLQVKIANIVIDRKSFDFSKSEASLHLRFDYKLVEEFLLKEDEL